jgi:CBS domain-containing protein
MIRPKVPKAANIMNANPVVLKHDVLIPDAAKAMWKKQVPVAAVIDDEQRPLGILSQQGMMLALLDVVGHERPAGPVVDYLDPTTRSISEEIPLLLLAEIFVRRGYAVRALPVVRKERLVGLIWRRDVVHAVMDYLSGAKSEHLNLYLSALKDVEEQPHFD